MISFTVEIASLFVALNKGGILSETLSEGQSRRKGATLDRALHSLDVQNARNAFNRVDNLIQVLDVEDLNGHLDVSSIVRGNRGARIANACLQIGNRARDSGDHAGAVLCNGKQFDGVSCFFRPSGPLHLDYSLPINHQRGYILTALFMNGHAFASGDVTNDFFAVKRVATARANDHQIVDAAHYDRIVTQADKSLDGADATSEPRLFLFIEVLELLGTEILSDHVARNQLPVADACK